MATHDIARENWKTFFDEFSRRHQGARVTIETVHNPQADPEFAARAMPFVGIVYEAKGGEAETIEIITGTEADDHASHTLAGPKHVYHKSGYGIISDEVDHNEALEITASGDPAVTYLRFLSPANKGA